MDGTNLDLNTTDPEQLAKVFEQLESGEQVKAADPPPPEPENVEQAQTKPESKEAEEPKAEQQAEAETQDEPAGVATKDGKHVIPYSVLKNERERASRAEQMAKEMQERVAALEQQLKAGSQGAKDDGESARTDAMPAVEDLSQEDLEALKEDFPTVYKTVMASMAAVKALEAKLKPVEESVQKQESDRERTVAEQVQDAIDSVPKLSHIQSSNAEAFELAKSIDATLRQQPKWASKPLRERFEKVVEMVESAMGEIQLPGTPSPQPKSEDLKKAAQDKAAKAAKSSQGSVPTSLSEFPSGQAPAIDDRDEAENLTPIQLAAKFAAMTPDQMDAYFRSM